MGLKVRWFSSDFVEWTPDRDLKNQKNVYYFSSLLYNQYRQQN